MSYDNSEELSRHRCILPAVNEYRRLFIDRVPTDQLLHRGSARSIARTERLVLQQIFSRLTVVKQGRRRRRRSNT